MRSAAWVIVVGGFFTATVVRLAWWMGMDKPHVMTNAHIAFSTAFIVLMLLKPEWFRREG